MTHSIRSLFIIAIALFHFSILYSQSCNCTIAEVQSNSVSPCNLTIGNVVNVSSAAEFRNAINQANLSGGAMTILIEDGTYEIASPVSYPYITASNLVIRSASGNRDMVILHGQGMTDVSPNTENGLHVAGNNVTIADLTIKDVGNHGIQVSGHHLFVHNVKIQNTYQQMLKGATLALSIDSAIVQCSLFEYTAGIGPNFYIGGLDIHKGKNWVVRDNIFKNISSPSGSVAEHAVHFWTNSQGNIIERNMIVNCDRGIGFGLGNSPNNEGIIRNNMIYNDGNDPYNDVGIGLESSPGTRVYNNSIFIQYQNAIEYRFASTIDVDIKNNLTNRPITSRDGGQASLASNFTGAQSDWFVNTSSGDLRLAEIVAAVVDQGTDLSDDVEEDIDQTPRPQGLNYDIGAHELLPTSSKEVHAEPAFKIYPNPTTGVFNIENFAEDTSIRIEIYTSSGMKIFTRKFDAPNKIHKVDLSAFPDGLYLLTLHSNEKFYSNKLIVNRKS